MEAQSMARRARLAVIIALAGLAASSLAARAAPPQLALPMACDPGASCWIVNYLDHDRTDGVRDYTCGIATYNTGAANAHNGTDFAIRDEPAMTAGVDVLAAAAGTVMGARDGMDDVSVKERGRVAVEARECGNGVRIDHGDGWTTQYCHLKNGSVAVKKGQRVTAGARLGQVGLSGLSEYPHLHFQVESGGEPIDPFVGAPRATGCGLGETPLWRADVLAELAYRPTAVYLAGFATGQPVAEQARRGGYGGILPAAAPALVLWADAFNVRAGDRIVFTITDPAGKVLFSHSAAVDKDQARRFAFAGRKRPAEDWQRGAYQGEVRIVRGGEGKQGEVVSLLTTTLDVR
jgi:hypothetical protein